MAQDDREQEEQNGQSSATYEVGYGKPPVQHRFKKGQSGNPAGRPRGNKSGKAKVTRAPMAADEILLEEAYRPITIREGEELIELPAIQAVFRSMGVAAMKGNRLSQRLLAELVREVEDKRLKVQLDNLEHFQDYKHRWDEEIERCEKAGLPDPDPLPHPDDIILNFKTGDVDIHGPTTKEERVQYDAMIKRRDEAQECVSDMKSQYEAETDERLKEIYLDEWIHEQKIFDIVNEGLGWRYQVDLEDRCSKPGATRKGDMRKEYGFKWPF